MAAAAAVTRLAVAAALPLLAACGTDAEAARRTTLVAAIDSVVQATLAIDPTPGMSVAVVHRGDTLVIRGYGIADARTGAPVTDSTTFAIASITKTFTAAAVMRLVEQGRLGLDDSVATLLPDYRGPGRTATVAQLLNHTSGIPDYTGLDRSFWNPEQPHPTSDELLALFSAQPAEFAPGTRWAYSNSAYHLLGMIIARAAGEGWAEFVERRIAAPAGLADTRDCAAGDSAADAASGHAVRLGEPVVSPLPALEAIGPAGGLCSTARDLVRWARALDDGAVVSPASYARMTAPTRVGGGTEPYGLGMAMAERDGHRFVGHGGSLHLFRSTVAHYPDEDLTIAVLANGPAPTQYVLRDIARLVLPPPDSAAAGAPSAP